MHNEKGAQTMNETIKTLLDRRSCKSYLPKQVVEAVLQLILTAGTYAANGMARQAPKILVLQDPEKIAKLERLNASFMGNPDLKPFYGAPTVCWVLADPSVRTAVEDGSLVIGNMMAAAWSLGVGSCWIHRGKEEAASEEGKALLRKWGLPENLKGVGNCILGYAAEEPAAKPRLDGRIVKVD